MFIKVFWKMLRFDGSIRQREYYWMKTLKTLYSDGLNNESDC